MRGLVRALDRLVEGVAAGLVVAILVSVSLGVVTRAWNDPLAWTDELSRFLMVWLAMAGWILATRRRAHVRIRFFQSRLPPPLHRAAERLIQAGMLVLGALVAWFGVELIGRNLDLEATSMPVSIAWMYVPLVPAGLATMLQAVAEMRGA